MPSGWTNSTRKQRLPANWETLRQQILNRDNHTCQIGLDGCTTTATEVDHTTPGDNHDPTNLRAACHWCNQRANILTRPTRPTQHRPPEQHPGLLT